MVKIIVKKLPQQGFTLPQELFRIVTYSTKNYTKGVTVMDRPRKIYMGCLHFTDDEKEELIQKLTNALPALRGAAKVSQSELAEAVGVSRQTYGAIELRKRKMSWNTYMSLILFFDYNPNTHDTIRQLDVFPLCLDECKQNGETELTD